MYLIPSTQGGSRDTDFWRLPSSALQEGLPTHVQEQLQSSIGFIDCPRPGPVGIPHGRQIGQICVFSRTGDQDPESEFPFQAFE